MSEYKKNSLTLAGAVSLGTGVMVGAGIFALLGQVAQLSGALFPIAFIVGGIVSGFSSYTYIKMSNAYPSAGGIGMILMKEYGMSTVTASAALLMTFSMIINESLVARTFGTYVLQIFNAKDLHFMVPILGVVLIVIAFIVNWSGNDLVEKTSTTMAILKIGGIAVFAIGALAATGFSFGEGIANSDPGSYPIPSYLGALALTILAYKGFTTITNSGSEIVNPHKNVGRAIVISLIICAVIYLLVSFAVSSNLSIDEIIKAKDYSLAAASEPAFGKYGLWFTVGIAIIATASGIIASIFAVSRMTAMLTEMKLIPHSHLGMKGPIQKHMLVYIAVIAIVLTVFFDLSRIAAMGAIFYIIMDIIIQWGVLTRMRGSVKASPVIVVSAILFDLVILSGFVWVKATTDPLVLGVAGGAIVLIFFGERLFLKEKGVLDGEGGKKD